MGILCKTLSLVSCKEFRYIFNGFHQSHLLEWKSFIQEFSGKTQLLYKDWIVSQDAPAPFSLMNSFLISDDEVFGTTMKEVLIMSRAATIHRLSY